MENAGDYPVTLIVKIEVGSPDMSWVSVLLVFG